MQTKNTTDAPGGAADAFLARYRPHMLAVARRLHPGDEGRAQDVTQEAMLKAWHVFRSGRLRTGAPDATVRAYLKRIVRSVNDHQNRYERAKKRYQIAPESSVDAYAEVSNYLPDSLRAKECDTPEPALMIAEVGGDLYAALAKLRPCLRRAVLLKYVEGYSICEVSLAMGVTIPMVNRFLSTAKSRLRRTLERESSAAAVAV